MVQSSEIDGVPKSEKKNAIQAPTRDQTWPIARVLLGIEIIISLQEYQIELPIAFSVWIMLLNAKYHTKLVAKAVCDDSRRFENFEHFRECFAPSQPLG